MKLNSYGKTLRIAIFVIQLLYKQSEGLAMRQKYTFSNNEYRIENLQGSDWYYVYSSKNTLPVVYYRCLSAARKYIAKKLGLKTTKELDLKMTITNME